MKVVTDEWSERQETAKQKQGTYEHHDRKHNSDAVECAPFEHAVNDVVHSIHKAAGFDTIPESDTIHGQEDNHRTAQSHPTKCVS